MVFSSHIFILAFLPLTLFGTFLARYLFGHRGALVALTLASMIFYAYWDWRFLALLWASILFNYYWSRLLLRPYDDRTRGWLLAIGVGANVATLGFFKYTNFFLDNIAHLIGQDFSALYIILPLGISFITFQKIAYLVDVWRDRPKPYGLLEYALFVSFFPQLIAGPIVHHRELIPQIQDERLGAFRLESFNRGVAVFVIGLAKKVLIADNINSYADAVFAAAQRGETLSGLEAWGGTLAYALQLYFDFSGYADMAIGLALMLGLWLPENFDRPYIATSISDFWRRWHITLSRFLRDYLYIPLGGNRHGFAKEMRNLLTTMVLGGIWHGAAWAFLLWGGCTVAISWCSGCGRGSSITCGCRPCRARSGRSWDGRSRSWRSCSPGCRFAPRNSMPPCECGMPCSSGRRCPRPCAWSSATPPAACSRRWASPSAAHSTSL